MAMDNTAVQIFTLPWRLVSGIVTGVATVLRRIPGVKTAWRMRAAVVAIAIYQTFQSGQYRTTVSLVALGTLSYFLPWSTRYQSRMLDLAVAEDAREVPPVLPSVGPVSAGATGPRRSPAVAHPPLRVTAACRAQHQRHARLTAHTRARKR